MNSYQRIRERWFKFSLAEQLANIGSEVIRAINWKEKDREDYSKEAALRAIELIDLTVEDQKNRKRLKEVVRLRELLADFLWFDNQYNSTAESFKKYFLRFQLLCKQYKMTF